VIRSLTDDTLLVFLSDCHIGGDEGRDIFESPDDLVSLFDSLGDHTGPLELVLAGDFFDLLRIAEVSEGQNRASATVSRPEYGELFAALARLAAQPGRTVVYLPGNHDAEAWWNQELRADLQRAGLVHEFALSYGAAYESALDEVVYCEHGNQFDPTNTIRDYDDPLDSPLGEHVVTDFLPRIPRGWEAEGGSLRDVDRVFPLALIPVWLAGRAFYHYLSALVRWLVLPLVVLLGAHAFLQGGTAADVLLELAYDAVVILLVFAVFLVVVARMSGRATRGFDRRGPVVDERERIRRTLERREPLPMSSGGADRVAVFASGHTHAPALTPLERPDGSRAAIVNSGCWLRQLRLVPARLGLPPVFVSRFVQTHVRVYRADGKTQVELWEHPRPSQQRIRSIERLAALGRVPAEPETRVPHIRAQLSL
jgi:UDP-2,3-diacylglucosamine pyrophosphatase LpxH